MWLTRCLLVLLDLDGWLDINAALNWPHVKEAFVSHRKALQIVENMSENTESVFWNITYDTFILQAQSGDDDMGGDNVAVSMEESKMDDFFQEVRIWTNTVINLDK